VGKPHVTQGIKWPLRPLIDICQYGFTLKTSKLDFRSSFSKPVEAGEKPYERTLEKCTIGQQFLDFCTIGQEMPFSSPFQLTRLSVN